LSEFITPMLTTGSLSPVRPRVRTIASFFWRIGASAGASPDRLAETGLAATPASPAALHFRNVRRFRGFDLPVIVTSVFEKHYSTKSIIFIAIVDFGGLAAPVFIWEPDRRP